ncbi:MAG TPA: hypothetical protein VFM05_11245, partial [Candidatus Saccharimonadales bacterium]|nr:hypothetical protein [Candidatus Saccharimonadales bacterium]
RACTRSPANYAGAIVVGLPPAGTACAFSPVPAATPAPSNRGRCAGRQFAWPEAGSGKVALSHPAHQWVTHTVRRK